MARTSATAPARREPITERQLVFDLFREESAAPVEPFITTAPEVSMPEPVAEIEIPRVAAPEWPRDVANDPLMRRYQSGASFVHLSGERAGKGWRASLLLTVDGSFEMGEPFAMSPVHKTLGDALGSVRHHAMERLRAEAARIHGSFPPPKGSEPHDATALYWALGREDFRELPDPEETPVAAPVADPGPIVEPALEVAPITEEIRFPTHLASLDSDNSLDEESLDWRVAGALARIRVFRPRPDTGETWTWSVEWSTGSSSEVEGRQPAESRKDCITRGRSRLMETFSGIATKGEAYSSRKAEYDRTCELYRVVTSTTPFNPSGDAEPLKEAA